MRKSKKVNLFDSDSNQTLQFWIDNREQESSRSLPYSKRIGILEESLRGFLKRLEFTE